MKKNDTKFSAALFLAIAIAFILVSCSTDNTMAPNVVKDSYVVQSNTGPVTLLQVDNALGKRSGAELYAEQFITAADGGALVVGNTLQGFSTFTFEPNALPQDLLISVSWCDGQFCEGVFNPHGTQFNQPVRVELSYKRAVLRGIDENDLKVYYYNEDTDLWEYIGGEVDTENKVIVVYLEHFSRYAIVKT